MCQQPRRTPEPCKVNDAVPKYELNMRQSYIGLRGLQEGCAIAQSLQDKGRPPKTLELLEAVPFDVASLVKAMPLLRLQNDLPLILRMRCEKYKGPY
eukprot:3730494-Amphidinium_carterae.1